MKLLKFLILIATLAVFSSCSKSDNDDDKKEEIISENEIPKDIKIYLSTHFPDNKITKAVRNKELSTIKYEIYLEGYFELEFNSDYKVIEIEGKSKLPDSVIQKSLLDYVAKNYANNFIISWELEHNYQQIKLNNRIKLEFGLDGTFIRIDH